MINLLLSSLLVMNMGFSSLPNVPSQQDVDLLAKVAFLEARGVPSVTERACVMWTMLNRVDAGYGSLHHVVTAPNQFAYNPNVYPVNSHGFDFRWLARDVLIRYELEKLGFTGMTRVLPKDFLWFNGYKGHNRFRNVFDCNSTSYRWDYSLQSPYES